jgi:hypothetical protein
MLLQDALQFERAWRGSMDELARKASALSAAYPVEENVHLPDTTRALVISYRTRKIIPPANGKQFTWDHLVRLLAARYLVMRGWNRDTVAQRLQEQSADYLVSHLTDLSIAPAHAQPDNEVDEAQRIEEATIAVQLLAAGIVQQFGHVRRGEVLVQDASMSHLLAQAMLLLAGLFLKAGQDNVFGSVHDLLVCCQKPLTSVTFGLDIFSHETFPYKDLVLIDPGQRIPTLDCVELARQSSSELDLREQLAFDALRSASEQLAGHQEEAYSDLRLWITEHPVTSAAKMRSFAREEGLQVAASFLSACYEPVNPRHLINGELHVCSTCGAPMRRSRGVSSLFACTIPQCARFDVPVDSVARDIGPETLIARAHILLYWVGPGLDESAIYRRAQKLGLAPRAYPGHDACDISLESDTVGVDVKSYSNPYLLAAKLNTSLGGLALYPTRIVAINDQVLARFYGYLDIVRNRYSGALPVRFMSVRELMKTMEAPF